MKASTVVMCSNENVIPSTASIPELHLSGHMIHCCLHECRCMSKPRKARFRAKFTRDVHRHEEKIRFVGVEGPDRTVHQNFMNGYLGSKQMIGTAFIDHPVIVELCWQVVDIDSDFFG